MNNNNNPTPPPPPPKPQEPEEGRNLRHYWHLILERRWIVLTAFISTFILTLLYLFKATPIYQATTQIEIERLTGSILNLNGQTYSLNSQDQDYLQTQYRKLQSPTLIQNIIQKLKLQQDPRYATSPNIIKALANDIEIDPIRFTRLVDIKAQHTNPKTAAQIANALTTLFIDENLNQKKNRAWQSFLWLQNEATTLEQDVQNAALAVHQFRLKHNLVSLEDNLNITAQALITAQQDYAQAQKHTSDLQQTTQQITQAIQQNTPLETIPYVDNTPIIQQLKTKLIDQQANLASLLKRYKNKYPRIIELRQQIQTLQQSIQTEAQKAITTLQQKHTIAQQQQKAAHQHLQTIKTTQHNLSEKKVQYDALVRKLNQNTQLYEAVLAKTKQTDLTAKEYLQNMQTIYPAKPPTKPYKPNTPLILTLGILGGLAIGFTLALLLHFLDDAIKSQDDIETYLRLDFLGYIPNIRTNNPLERDLQSHRHPQSNPSESFRTIRAAINLTHPQENLHTLALTSTTPSEGKSLIASNLAIVTAQTGLKTLLIDADLRRPSIHKAFQLQSPTGLTQYLLGQIQNHQQITHTTDIPNLHLICSGSIPHNPSELVGSQTMNQLIQQTQQHYDRILIDCPPVSAVSDPLIIASHCDGVIFINKFGKIRREHARRSIQRIQNAGVKIIGVVINDIDFEGKDSYYYTYYYYQNRYYTTYNKKDPKQRPDPKPTPQPATTPKT